MLGSQGLVLATAMAVSAGTLILIDLFREKYCPSGPQLSGNQDSLPRKPVLRSCLSPGGNKQAKKKKRVQFADDLKDSSGNGEEYRKAHRKSQVIHTESSSSCRKEVLGIQGMPANRVALYAGILKDRVQRMEFSY